MFSGTQVTAAESEVHTTERVITNQSLNNDIQAH